MRHDERIADDCPGRWALDLLNDTLPPSLLMLAGATALLGSRWPMMGVVVGIDSVLSPRVSTAKARC